MAVYITWWVWKGKVCTNLLVLKFGESTDNRQFANIHIMCTISEMCIQKPHCVDLYVLQLTLRIDNVWKNPSFSISRPPIISPDCVGFYECGCSIYHCVADAK